MGLEVGYCRISVSKQSEESSSIETQRRKLEAAGVSRLFVDDGWSGGKEWDEDRRPGLRALREAMLRREISVIRITRIDRLSRSTTFVKRWLDLCRRLQISVIDESGQDLAGVSLTMHMQVHLNSTMSEFERMQVSMRVRSANQRRREDLKPMAGFPPWGYRWSEDKSHFEIDKTQWRRVQQFLSIAKKEEYRYTAVVDRWKAEGDGPIPFSSRKGMHKWLANPVLQGHTRYTIRPAYPAADGMPAEPAEYKLNRDTHVALISRNDARLIESKLKQRSFRRGVVADQAPRLFSGLCVCVGCGKRLCYRRLPGGYHILRCQDATCPQRYLTIRESYLEQYLPGLFAQKAQIIQEAAEGKAVSPELEAKRAQLEQLQALKASGVPQLDGAIVSCAEEIKDLEEVGSPLSPADWEPFKDPSVYWCLGPEEKRELLLLLVENLRVALDTDGKLMLSSVTWA